jgi:uroporphyrinogen-III synthase
VRGENGRELLADALRQAGVEVEQLAAYRRAAPDFTAERRERLAELLEQDCRWVITSSESLRILAGWAAQLDKAEMPGAVAKMQHQQIIVPHLRIAETAEKLGFARFTLTGSGDEAVLVALQS